MRIFLKAFPLAEQQGLGEAHLLDPARQFSAGLGQGSGFLLHQILRPIEVTRAVVFGFQRFGQGVIFQLVRLELAESLEGRPKIRARSDAKVAPSPFE